MNYQLIELAPQNNITVGDMQIHQLANFYLFISSSHLPSPALQSCIYIFTPVKEY